MEFSKDCKYWIVADKVYHRFLYSFKEKNPFLDIKIIQKKELLDLLSFTYQKDPVPYLLSFQKWDYSSIVKILDILRIGRFETIEEFKDIYEDLKSKGYLNRNPLGERTLDSRQILLFESKEDMELVSFLDWKKKKYKFITFLDLGKEPVYSAEKEPVIYSFDNKYLQFLYLFSDLRKKIHTNPDSKDKISVIVKDDKDFYFISFFSSLFKLPVHLTAHLPLVSDREVSNAIESFYEKKNFSLPDDIKEGSLLLSLKDIIQQYHIDEIRDFMFAYSSLMEILSKKTYELDLTDSGIQVTNQLFFAPETEQDRLIYVCDFQHDSFYKEFDDNNVLSDSLLEKIGVNPSYIKTKIDREKKKNFILYHPFVFLSRVLIHLKDKIYPSQFLSEFGWKETKPEKYNPNGIYTSIAKSYVDGYFQDSGHYGPSVDYRSYDHSFSGVDKVRNKDYFSITEFETYFKCPYSYYLDRILKLSNSDKDVDKTANYRGEMIHKVFENIYTKDYTMFDKAFEESFQKGLDAYKENKKENLTIEEEAYIQFIHKWLRDIIKIALSQRDHSRIDSENWEVDVPFVLTDSETKLPVHARIDKIVHTQGESGQKYYTIIDYKTGSSGDFDFEKVFLGGSLQLPLYYLAVHDENNQKLISNQTEDFGGFGIEHIYCPSSVPTDSKLHEYNEKAIYAKMQIKGITSSDLDYLSGFDNTTIKKKKDGTLSVQNGNYLNTRYSIGNSFEDSLIAYEYTMQNLVDDAKKAAMRICHNISEGNFAIQPIKDSKTGRKGKEKCSYCPYLGICYHNKNDIRDIRTDINGYFNRNFDEDCFDEEDDENEDYVND